MFPLYRIGFYNAVKTIRYKGNRTRHIKCIEVPLPLFIIRLFKNIEFFLFLKIFSINGRCLKVPIPFLIMGLFKNVEF